MGTVPTLRTWTSNEPITGAKLNEIRDALSFSFNPPRVHLSNSDGTSCANGSPTRLLFPNTVSDTDGMYQDPGRARVTTAGRYQVTLGIGMPAATYTVFNLQVRINSAGSATGGTNLRTMPQFAWGGGQLMFTFERDFVVNDYIEPFLTQTSGAARTTDFPTLGTFIQLRWISQ